MPQVGQILKNLASLVFDSTSGQFLNVSVEASLHII